MEGMSHEESCVARVPIFSGLDAAAQAQVSSYARPRRVASGEALYREGEPVAQLFVVHEGVASITHRRADGRERLVRTVGSGQVIGENAFLTGARPDHTATALEPLVACVFDHREIARLTAQHPEIAVAMLQALSTRLADAERRLAVLGSSDVATRIADYLLSLPPTPQSAGFAVELPMSKRNVASYLGTTPESFSRALARLEKRGAIAVDGSRVELLDLDALDQLAS